MNVFKSELKTFFIFTERGFTHDENLREYILLVIGQFWNNDLKPLLLSINIIERLQVYKCRKRIGQDFYFVLYFFNSQNIELGWKRCFLSPLLSSGFFHRL